MFEIMVLGYLDFLMRSAQICKMHFLGNLRTNDPILFIYLLSSNCLWYSFLYLKIAKIYFHRVLFSSILVCKVPEFRSCKLWDQNFVSLNSGSIHIQESKKPDFFFFFRVENQIFLILWSTFACSRMLICIGLKLKFWNFKPIFLKIKFSLVVTFFLYFWLSVWVHLKLSHELLTFISFNIWR